jgi:GDP-mannose 6-dehydrogenase
MQGVSSGRLNATSDGEKAVADTEISLICVGTPSLENGNLNISTVKHVCREIGTAMTKKKGKHFVVIRSTVLPGTLYNLIIPTLEKAVGGVVGERFGLAHNPEFLREGAALNDFRHPPKTVIGATDTETGSRTAALYARIDAPLFLTSIEVSEMVKYVANVWHATKICFANEIGNICKAQQVDSHAVMDIFAQDKKLNISAAYLKPGFAFGGSCLPKDTRALAYRAKELDLDLPLIGSILPSNQQQIERAIRIITARQKKRISVLGFSFKAGTDDLRESPIVELIERLIGKGYDLRLYDLNVSLAALVGTNRDYILNVIPHISNLLVETIDAALEHAELVVIGNHAPEFEKVPKLLRAEQLLIDLVRLKNSSHLGECYEGINWDI